MKGLMPRSAVAGASDTAERQTPVDMMAATQPRNMMARFPERADGGSSGAGEEPSRSAGTVSSVVPSAGPPFAPVAHCRQDASPQPRTVKHCYRLYF